MTVKSFGGGGGGASAVGDVFVPTSVTISGGATWAWNFSDGTGAEQLNPGATNDITSATFHVTTISPDSATAGLFDARRSSSAVDTGSIGAAVRIQTAVTVACWIKREATIGTNLALCGARIAGAGENNNIQWELGVDAATDEVRWIHQDGAADNTNIVNASTAIVVDTWEHWTGTRNTAGTIVKLYKNGVLDATSGTLNKATGGSNINKITVGNNISGVEFPGYMTNVVVYEEELDATQVLALYNSTSTKGEWD